jgi:hypothetical protein
MAPLRSWKHTLGTLAGRADIIGYVLFVLDHANSRIWKCLSGYHGLMARMVMVTWSATAPRSSVVTGSPVVWASQERKRRTRETVTTVPPTVPSVSIPRQGRTGTLPTRPSSSVAHGRLRPGP